MTKTKSPNFTVPVTEEYLQGTLSALRDGEFLLPCRLPHQRKHFFPAPDDSLWDKAIRPSGVRLRLETDATRLALEFRPLGKAGAQIPRGHAFDAVIDNRIIQVRYCKEGTTEAAFNLTGKGLRTVELWLPPSTPVWLRTLRAERATVLRPMPDRRPLWVTWGSSLTHCVRAGSAARVWPATVARKRDLNLLNLGFGGSCQLDPLVAMTIRDLPASFISMKLGINAVKNALSARTYAPLVAAAIAIVREKHAHTPLALISPMSSPPLETTPGNTGYTLEGMRTDMEAVHRAFVEAGDRYLYYVNGLDFFGPADIAKYSTDQCHPNAKGIDLQAQRFDQLVMPLLTGQR